MVRSMVASMINPDSGGGIPPDINGEINIIPIGASIMLGTFGDNVAAEAEFTTVGLSTKVYNKGVGGDQSSATLAKLPATLAEFAGQGKNSYIVMHTGGNDMSIHGPYPAAQPGLGDNWVAILDMIEDAGFLVAPSTLTYRTSGVAEDYNINVIQPIVQAKVPHWYGEATTILDYYTLIFNNMSWLTDGIHLNPTGYAEMRKYTAETFASNITQTNNSILDPVSTITDIIVNLGVSGGVFQNELNNNTLSTVRNTNNLVASGVELSMTGGVAASINQGRGNEGDYSLTLLNDYIQTSYWYVQAGTMIISFSGTSVVPLNLYTVGITASRDTTDTNRVGEYTVGGVTKTLDAATVTPESIEFTGVTGQQLIDDGIVVVTEAGSAFSYVSGLTVAKE